MVKCAAHGKHLTFAPAQPWAGLLGPFFIQPRGNGATLGFGGTSRTPVGSVGTGDPQNLTDLINGVVLLANLMISREPRLLGLGLQAVRRSREKKVDEFLCGKW